MTKYFGCILNQRLGAVDNQFFIFIAKARDLSSWVGIRRSHESAEGIQRLLNKSRVRAISRFLEADGRNTIPNNILISIEKDRYTFSPLKEFKTISLRGTEVPTISLTADPLTDMSLNQETESLPHDLTDIDPKNGDVCTWGLLDIGDIEMKDQSDTYPAYIIDGQHRLFGVAAYKSEDIPLLVVAMLGASVQEQAFQFVVVNNKSVRVPTDNVKSIIAGVNEDELQLRLIGSGITYGNKSPILRELNDLIESPFYHLLDWDYNREGTRMISLTTIEQCLRYMKKIFDIREESEDGLFDIFSNIWRPIVKKYTLIWGTDCKLMTKVGMSALNELVIDSVAYSLGMGYLTDINDGDQIEREVTRAVVNIPVEFWTMGWTIDKIQDNANVREIIKHDLDKIRMNVNSKSSWRKELKLIPSIDNSTSES